MLIEVKRAFPFSKFLGLIPVALYSYYHVKYVSPKYGAILPRQGIPLPLPIQIVSINAAAPAYSAVARG